MTSFDDRIKKIRGMNENPFKSHGNFIDRYDFIIKITTEVSFLLDALEIAREALMKYELISAEKGTTQFSATAAALDKLEELSRR